MELTCIVYILAKLMLAQEKQKNLPKVCVVIINMPSSLAESMFWNWNARKKRD
jgi:hypothetical protein